MGKGESRRARRDGHGNGADHQSVNERAGRTGGGRVFHETGDAPRCRRKIPRHVRHSGSRGNARDLEIRAGTFLAVGSGRRRPIERPYGEEFRIVGGENPRKRLEVSRIRPGRPEFVGIEFELGVIGISSGIIGSGGVPIASGERYGASVDVRERTGKGRARIVDDEIPGRLAG